MNGGGGKVDDEDRKLFLGGLSWETTEDDVRNHFSKYGQVESVSIKYDAMTHNPRGFGFITFSTASVIDAILSDGPHKIRDKQIDPKRAKSRPTCKKIFVGGVDTNNLSDEEIKKYFSKYGNVEGIEFAFDRAKGRKREFCFIIFESEEAADAACRQPKQNIGGRDVDIKKAQPQPVAQQMKRAAAGPEVYSQPGYPGPYGPAPGRGGPRGPPGRGFPPRGDPYTYDGYGQEGWYGYPPPPSHAPPPSGYPGYYPPPPSYATGTHPPPPASYDHSAGYGGYAAPPAPTTGAPPHPPPAPASYPGYGAPSSAPPHPPPPAAPPSHEAGGYGANWNGYSYGDGSADPYGYPGPENYSHPPAPHGHPQPPGSAAPPGVPPSQSTPGKIGRRNPTSSYHPYAPRAQH